jgi:hypothetical protein
MLLLAAAVWAVWSNAGAFNRALDSARDADALLVVLVLLLPGLNWLLSSMMFHAITSRHGHVARPEMLALMGSAWLLNMLPMRPGLAGRIAYHRLVNAIPLKASAVILVHGLSVTACALGLTLLAVLGTLALEQQGPPRDTPNPVLLAPVAMLFLATLALRATRPGGLAATLAFASCVRAADVLTWAVRYWLVFGMLGAPITPTGAIAIAVASMAAGLLPVPIGLREWVVGLTAAALPGGFWSAVLPHSPGNAGTMADVTPGLVADMTMRAVDLLWAIPVGAICSWWLFRRVGAARRATSAPNSSAAAQPPHIPHV